MKWEENVRKVVPYTPGEQPAGKNIIKLNTNECPYPPAPGVAKRMAELDTDKMRLYPAFPENTELAKELADFYHIDKEELFIGVGSDDVLSMAFLTFFNSGKPILFPDVTYSFYDVWADLYRIPYHTCALDENWHINPEDYKQPNGGVIFPNPNAPTGVEESQELIEEILQANPDVVVIVDEAYVDFGGTSALPLLKKYENLLVVQTFSKSRAMAGMRIGFCIGNEKLIHYLNDVKFSFNSYTMNLPSQVMGVEAVKDKAYFDDVYSDYGLLLCQADGRPIDQKALGKAFKELQRSLRIPKEEQIEFQGLRKSGQMHKVRLTQNNYQLVAENSGQSPEVLMSSYNEAREIEKRALAAMVERSFYPEIAVSTPQAASIMEVLNQNPDLAGQILKNLLLQTAYAQPNTTVTG